MHVSYQVVFIVHSMFRIFFNSSECGKLCRKNVSAKFGGILNRALILVSGELFDLGPIWRPFVNSRKWVS